MKALERRARSGLSFGQLFREGLGLVESKIATKEAAFEESFDAGYAEVKKRYGLILPCPVCGEAEAVEAESVLGKAAIAALVQAGWGHRGCLEGVPQQR
jgi:hypothetical protein